MTANTTIRRRRHPRWPVAAAAVLAVCACTNAQQGPSQAAAPAAAALPSEQPSTTPSPSAAALDASGSAPRRVAGVPVGGSDTLGYTVEIPATGWEHDASFTLKESGPSIGFSVWDVGRVPSDPCHPLTTMGDPGPTVEDLAQALVAQASRNASTPSPVTLAGHDGLFLEWSVPADAVVTGDADFEGCDVQANGHKDFVSWRGDGGGTRYQQAAGQIDQLWILDVNGHRLLVDASWSPGASPAARDELSAIVASLEFDD